MQSSRIRVLVVDDHELARAGLRGVLEDEGDIEVVAEGRDGVEALALYQQHRPDVVLMDVRMPHYDGIQATASICREDPRARVLVISSYDTEEEVFRVNEAGARGYLLKEARAKEVIEAIRAVAGGGRYLPPVIAARLAGRKEAPVLNARERQVLQLVQRGLSNPEIGAELALSMGTIRMYVSQILDKLGAANRTEAVSIAIARGLIRPE